MESWAKRLDGRITDEGFLVLTAMPPLKLQETGGHEGPQLLLGEGNANWIDLTPRECAPEDVSRDEEPYTARDGTQVGFSRVGGGFKHNRFASWCEDGKVQIQVEYAYEEFARAAAEEFRMRKIELAPSP
jgi:hypothetical protein